MSRLLRVLVVLLCLALGGCGMWAQREPVTIDVPVPTEPTAPPAPDGPRSVTVYLLRGDRLEAARRAADDRSVATAVELLAAGPTGPESRAGLRTAVPPESVRMVGTDGATGTVVVEVTADFVATTGTNQLLAVAQVVWTVTESPDVRLIRMTSNGNPIDVPTDEGLSGDPVGRDDYAAVAPFEDRSPDVVPGVGCQVATPC